VRHLLLEKHTPKEWLIFCGQRGVVAATKARHTHQSREPIRTKHMKGQEVEQMDGTKPPVFTFQIA
jgi:hypothetical protein